MKNFKMPKMPGMFDEEQDPKNPSILGAGRIEGGKYESINIAGSGEVTGDVVAKKIAVSGSGRVAGNLSADHVEASGSLNVRGSVKAKRFSSAGSSSIDRDLNAQTVEWTGSGLVGENLKADSFVSRGAFRVAKTLEAGDIDVELNGDSSVGTIEGKTIQVRRGLGQSSGRSASGGRGGSVSSSVSINEVTVNGRPSGGASFTYVSQSSSGKGAGNSRLEAGTISGDTIELENTDAQTVIGKNVTIGEGCMIDTVKYSKSISVHDKAKVNKQIKT
jgi:cytoskeletal protein CcmA (bactofilin family)